MTVNLLCIAGTNELASCSSMENDILHKSLEIHLEKSKHSLFYYMYEAKFHLQSLYSLFNYIHEQYIYFICTIQVMYIYSKCIEYSMNITQTQELKKCPACGTRSETSKASCLLVAEHVGEYDQVSTQLGEAEN